MPSHSLSPAWNWEYDADFAHLLEAACVRRGHSLLQVTLQNLAAVLSGLGSGVVAFAASALDHPAHC